MPDEVTFILGVSIGALLGAILAFLDDAYFGPWLERRRSRAIWKKSRKAPR